MTDRRKQAPKIAWRDLMKESDAPATPAADASAPREAVDVPASEEASSPRALAARLDAAYTAMMAETAREHGGGAGDAPATLPTALTSGTPLARPGGDLPPDNDPALARPVTSTVSAHADSPASVPAATPEAEVRRILDRLASYVPAARATAPAAAAPLDFAGPAVAVMRGPTATDDEAAPLIAPSGVRDAVRARHGRVELLLFRVGGELFALPLGAVEEAIETPAIHTLPEMPPAMLGVFNLRERLVPTYSPGPSLGVGLAEPVGAALLVRSGERRLALASDEVEDVMELDLSTLRDPPIVDDTDGILLGVARFGRDLVGILDADALISACLGGRNVENP